MEKEMNENKDKIVMLEDENVYSMRYLLYL
jgi:hypothetical protein